MSELNKEQAEFAQPRRLIAAEEITSTELEINNCHEMAATIDDLPSDLTTEQYIAQIAMRYAERFSAASPDNADRLTKAFLESPSMPDASLASIIMRGDWHSTDEFEDKLTAVMGTLFDAGYKNMELMVGSRKASQQSEIVVPAGYTKEYDFVAIRRKRRILLAQRQMSSHRHILSIDKYSTFALDIGRINAMSDEAAAEIRLVIACTMFKDCDWGIVAENCYEGDEPGVKALNRLLQDGELDFLPQASGELGEALEYVHRLRGGMMRHNITLDEILKRLYLPGYVFDKVRGKAAIHFVEKAIQNKDSELLTPAYTKYVIS